MSSVEINQVLAQMRVMAAASSGLPSNQENAPVGDDFSKLLDNAIQEVSDSQAQARELRNAFEAGEAGVELPEVMVAVQKASISFQAMNQVRNKLLNAYQEVMNMSV